MNIAEVIDQTEKGLTFFGLTHDHIDNLILIVLIASVLFIGRFWYTVKISCKGITCFETKKALANISSMERKLKSIEDISMEARTESTLTHAALTSDLERLDSLLTDLRTSTAELHGILIGAASIRDNGSARRSIIHDNQ